MVPKCDVSGRFSSPSVYFFVGRLILGLLVNKSAYLFVWLFSCVFLSLYICFCVKTRCAFLWETIVALQSFKQR